MGWVASASHITLQWKTTPPTVVPPRNLPAALRDRVKSTLDEIEQMKVIRRVDEPTE